MDPPTDARRPRRGRRPLRVVLIVLLVVVAVVVLFTWVFPWVESMQQDPTMATIGPQVLRAPR